MRALQKCKNCGAPAEERNSGQQVYVECTNMKGFTDDTGVWHEICGMRTPGFSASLEYGARDRVAEIWNRSIYDNPGSKDDPLPVPQAVYRQGFYYLDGEVQYLCFKEYDGSRRPGELIDHNFVEVE